MATLIGGKTPAFKDSIDFSLIIAYTAGSVNACCKYAGINFATMAYIIDGHNLIGVLPDIQLADPDDEARLLLRLRGYRARAGAGPLIVFFDTGPGRGEIASPMRAEGVARRAPGPPPGVTVRFAEPGQSADDAIVAFLRSEPQPGQYAVVTDDQELTWRVRKLGASAIRASDFAGRLAPRSFAGRAVRKTDSRGPAADPTPDPHAPAFADLYAGFMSTEKVRSRLTEAEPAETGAWLEKLYAEDAGEAQLAARWLGQHGGKDALEPLQDALTHSDARVRAAAALAFGDLGDRRALPALSDRLKNDSAGIVRHAAAQSLGRIGNRSVESTLEVAAGADSKSRVRKAARDALAQVRARAPGQGGAKPPS
jgi:uncharacterized protein